MSVADAYTAAQRREQTRPLRTPEDTPTLTLMNYGSSDLKHTVANLPGLAGETYFDHRLCLGTMTKRDRLARLAANRLLSAHEMTEGTVPSTLAVLDKVTRPHLSIGTAEPNAFRVGPAFFGEAPIVPALLLVRQTWIPRLLHLNFTREQGVLERLAGRAVARPRTSTACDPYEAKRDSSA